MERRLTTDQQPIRQPIAALGLSINDLMAALVAELEADGVPAALGQRLTLGFVWADLCRLAGEAPHPAVAALLDQPPAA